MMGRLQPTGGWLEPTRVVTEPGMYPVLAVGGEGMEGLGITEFWDPVPDASGAELATSAAAAVEAAKKAATAAEAERLMQQARELLRLSEAKAAAEAARAKEVPVVVVGDQAGTVLGMSPGVVLLIAGAGVLWMMSGKE